MQTCSHCGHLNPNEAVQCEECAILLDDRTIHKKKSLSQPATAAFSPGAVVLDECLLVLTPVGSGQELPLKLTLTSYALLGRRAAGQPPNMVDLSGLDAQKLGVSREHARINIRGNAVQLMDLGSANGTFINDQRLLANQYYGLQDGDVIKLGRLQLRVNLTLHN